jgi:hypothetical protein
MKSHPSVVPKAGWHNGRLPGNTEFLIRQEPRFEDPLSVEINGLKTLIPSGRKYCVSQ